MKIISLNRASFAFILGLSMHFTQVQADTLGKSLFLVRFQSSVTGTVSDSRGPIPGVTVMVKGTSIITTTNFDGRYTIQASKGDILVFSFIGFSTVEKIIDNSLLDIILSEDATTLKEVVINAGYYSVKDKERTGSIARITSKDLETQPVVNVLAAMQGRMAGVDIIQDSGSPTSGFRVKIRGQNSLRPAGNDPLYVIDGVPYSTETIGSANTSTALATPASPLTNINPSDVESIEVLKDADATAIYGSRGANGVVLVTTRRAKAGKTSVSFSASTGVGKVTRFIELMDTKAYLEMRKEAYANDGIAQYPANAYDINGTWEQNRYTDWQKELLGGTSEIRNYTGSVSGGSELTQFLLSGSIHNESTVQPGDFGYTKAGVHISSNHTTENKKFKMSFSGGYTFQDNLQSGTDLTRISRTLAPNAPELYDSEGNLNWENGTFSNPMASLESKTAAKVNDFVASASLTYNFQSGLQLKSSFGFTSLQSSEIRTDPSTAYNPFFGMGSESSSLFSSLVDRKSWIIEPQISWDKTIGKAGISLLGGATAQRILNGRLQQTGVGFTSNSFIENLSSAATKNITLSDETEYRYQAFFLRANLNWDGRYILNLTGRRDGSSRFGPADRFAWFGAAGAAWLFSKEKFMQQSKIISFGKLRASYGTSGNDQIGDYQYADTYASAGRSYDGLVGLIPSRLYNPNFGWEINKKIEVALEMGFFKDRLFLTGAYYRNRSSNQLIGVQLPRTTGFASINANLDATVENSGWEFTLRSENINNGDVAWSTVFNISAAKNRLLAFPGLEGSAYTNTYVIGKSINIAKLYQLIGIDSQTGAYTFTDYNNDGIISDPDRQHVADLTPKYFGGVQNQLRYKNLELDFLFQFVKQQTAEYTFPLAGTLNNQPISRTDRWTTLGDHNTYQRYTSGASSAAVQAGSRYAQSSGAIGDGSYIRLKNIALTYNLPLNHKALKCRIYFQGQNLLTFTPYKGGDPEFRFSGFLPPLKIYSVGIQLNF
ncbi:SusC/RagA family TonB-linked outer membrane protein [Flavobacterium sp. UW10123]|uniref:SusC/RagA family TonB-linked outer membrane protein n=1 Tax=Flavobacterium sp. UW10123 TaxID=3230800 RepID=UPI003395D20C